MHQSLYPLPLWVRGIACILKTLLKAWHCGVKFVVKSLLKAPPPGANNNEEQQQEVVLMKNKYDAGWLECLQVSVGTIKSM